MSSFSTTLSLQNQLLNSHKRFCSQKYAHIKWFKRFKEDREDIKDDEHPGQESFVITPSNIEIVREFIKNEPKSSLRHMAMELNMSKDSVHRIFDRKFAV